jgi:hypothetical protein
VSLGLLGLAGLLLSVERVCYAWIARAPVSFRDWCAQPLVGWLDEPVVVVRALFVAFKARPYKVFGGWCNTGDWVESCRARGRHAHPARLGRARESGHRASRWIGLTELRDQP